MTLDPNFYLPKLKKIVLFFTSVLCCNVLRAQSPIIDRSNEFSVGDSVLIYRISGGAVSSFSPGGFGGNVFWDFSGLDFTDASLQVDTLSFLDPVGTPFYPITLSADYSQSNLCKLRLTNPFDPSNFQYSYFLSNSNSLSLIGFAEDNGGSEHWEDHCTDLIKELSFPFAYQNNFVDSYQRYFFDMSGSDGHYITGTNTVIADAYGSIKTPDGVTIPNVLRVHTTLVAKDSNALFGIQTFTTNSYKWYSPGIKGFILALEQQGSDTTIVTAEYQKQTNASTNVTGLASGNAVELYPNPNSGAFVISNEDQKVRFVEVYNSLGQKVYSNTASRFPKKISISLPAAAKGVCFVQIYCEQGSVSRCIFVE